MLFTQPILLDRATILSKILSEQASSESRTDIQRAYDRLKQMLNNKSEAIVDHSSKTGKNFADKKQVVDRLLKMFEKRIESAGISDNFDQTEEENLMDPKTKVFD